MQAHNQPAIVSLIIPGPPVPWKRPGINRDRIFYNRQVTQAEMFKLHVQQQFKRAPFDTEPLYIEITFYMPIPSAQYGKYDNVYCTTTPDTDNLVKFVFDALQGVAYRNDKCIVEFTARKVWSKKPHTEIVIKPLADKEGNVWSQERAYNARLHIRHTARNKNIAASRAADEQPIEKDTAPQDCTPSTTQPKKSR